MAVTGRAGRVYKVTSTGDSIDARLYVTYFRWVTSTDGAAGDVLTVHEKASGDEIFKSVADGAQFIDIHPVYDMLDGVSTSAVGRGSLYVYMR